MIKETLTENAVKIRAVGEKHNDKVRGLYVEEARQRKIAKIKKWVLIVGIVVVLCVVGVGIWFVMNR